MTKRYNRARSLTFCALAFTGAVAQAQTALPDINIPLVPMSPAPATTATLKVRSVPVRIMAWWLDPEHQATPPQMMQARRNAEVAGFPNVQADGARRFGGPPGASTEITIKLPAGIQSVTAVDAQNALEVKGAPEAIEEVRAMVKELDRPIRQVEIEAQFVEISDEDAKVLGVDFSRAAPAPNAQNDATANSIAVLPVRGNVRQVLGQLVQQNRAKIINSPRVTAINGLTASLSAAQAQPLEVVAPDSSDPAKSNRSMFYVTSSIGLHCTPTINKDNTITLAMETPFQVSLEMTALKPGQKKSPSEAPVFRPDFSQKTLVPGAPVFNLSTSHRQTIFSAKDGETVAVAGYDEQARTLAKSFPVPLIFSSIGAPGGKGEPAKRLLILVTLRLVHRLAEDVPGV